MARLRSADIDRYITEDIRDIRAAVGSRLDHVDAWRDVKRVLVFLRGNGKDYSACAFRDAICKDPHSIYIDDRVGGDRVVSPLWGAASRADAIASIENLQRALAEE